MRIADCGFSMRDMFDISIRNPQSKIRNSFYSNAPKLIEIDISHDGLPSFGLSIRLFFSLKYAQGLYHRPGIKLSRRTRQTINLVGCLSAFDGVCEDIMDQKISPR